MHEKKTKQKNNQTFNTGNLVDVNALFNVLSNIKPLYHVKIPRFPALYKCPSQNLFWYRNLKAASTTYSTLFDQLEWHQCALSSVDWHNDIVFGHICDPLTRFRKGLTESFFYRSDYQNLKDKLNFIEDINLMKFVHGLRNIDIHCMTLEYILGSNAQKIYWIPIDLDFDHKTHTIDLLESFNLTIAENMKHWFINEINANRSTEGEIEFYEKLRGIPIDDRLKEFLDFDQCIYSVVQYYFDSSKKHA